MPAPLLIHLSLFVVAALLLYAGTQLLFRAFGLTSVIRPLFRGMALALPVIGCGIGLAASGNGSRGVALAVAAAAVMLTLGTGVTALGAGRIGAASASLRLLAPLAAAVTLIGFAGALTFTHGVLIGGMTFALLWARPENTPSHGNKIRLHRGLLWAAIGLFLLGSIATVFTVLRLGAAVPMSVTTPAIVLMLVVAALGLLATEAQAGEVAAPLDTVVGYVMVALGVAMPLTIFTALAHGWLIEAPVPATQPTTMTSVVLPTPLLMPVPTWRIDSVVLLVTSLYLIPAGFGRARLIRSDGIFLVIVGVVFLIATVATLGRLLD